MSIVPIKIFQIASTKVNKEEVRRWLDFIGAVNYQIPDGGAVSNPALVIALASKCCYKSFEPGLNPNVTKVRQDMVDYFDNILKSGHGSVLEHAVFSFAIENVSRVFTAEMNRHRAGWAISERSLRFCRFGENIPYWLPTSLQENTSDDVDLADRKRRSVEVFEKAFKHQERCYAELLEIWNMNTGHHNFHYKKVVTSCLRRIIGLGVATAGVWTGNARALRHVIALRASEAAEEEIFYVFQEIGRMMIESEPLLFGDFSQNENGAWVPKYIKV